jgi:hypothetical protein
VLRGERDEQLAHVLRRRHGSDVVEGAGVGGAVRFEKGAERCVDLVPPRGVRSSAPRRRLRGGIVRPLGSCRGAGCVRRRTCGFPLS